MILEQVSSHIYQIDNESMSESNGKKRRWSRKQRKGQEVDISNIQMSVSMRKQTTKSSKSRKQNVRNSTAKYREKKKKELQDLELSVRNLQQQLQKAQGQIQIVKSNIFKALQEKAKGNQLSSSHQNAEIISELESIIIRKPPSQFTAMTEGIQQNYSNIDMDIDKVNLLLDTLKYRIGASGRERQARINYNFKNIINTLFPALYRYILSTSVHQKDLFSIGNDDNISWTQQLTQKMGITAEQKYNLREYQPKLQNCFQMTMERIEKLNGIKQKLKQEGIRVEKVQQSYRQTMDPIQCAHWTLFAQKYKYRRQLALDEQFLVKKSKDEQTQRIKEEFPSKKVKRSPIHEY